MEFCVLYHAFFVAIAATMPSINWNFFRNHVRRTCVCVSLMDKMHFFPIDILSDLRDAISIRLKLCIQSGFCLLLQSNEGGLNVCVRVCVHESHVCFQSCHGLKCTQIKPFNRCSVLMDRHNHTHIHTGNDSSASSLFVSLYLSLSLPSMKHFIVIECSIFTHNCCHDMCKLGKMCKQMTDFSAPSSLYFFLPHRFCHPYDKFL